ncbi:MAG: type II secretion system protein [Sedimentisphaeraceae bacterium JB056]
MLKRKGFTLIELLVVISIIALLMAIMMPALGKAKDQAKVVLCGSNQHQILVALSTYTADNSNKMPPSVQGVGTYPDNFIWNNPPIRLNYEVKAPGRNGEYLGANGINGGSVGRQMGAYLSDPTVWQCKFAEKPYLEYYQEEYLNGFAVDLRSQGIGENAWPYLNSSYFLLWNYKGYERFDYNDPTTGDSVSKSKVEKIMIADFMMWNNGVWLGNKWGCSHRMQGSSLEGDHASGYFWKMTPSDNGASIPRVKTMNAGYEDGSVLRYDEQSMVKATLSGWNSAVYFPVGN